MKYTVTFALALLAFFTGCNTQENNAKSTVVATTNIVGDALKVLLKGVDEVEIKTLMGPGVDPHLYKASQGDIEALMASKLIVYNGLHLEGKLQGLLKKLKKKKSYALGSVLNKNDLINATEFCGAYDPHIWFDPTLYQKAIDGLSQQLIKTFPEQLEVIKANNAAYQKELNLLHQNNKMLLSKIPSKQRVLVTAHDAFKYFGRAYNIEVEALQGISTTAEYGLKDVADLADLIAARGIKAIFVESSVPQRSIEAVQNACKSRGATVAIGGKLYSDALGGPQSGANTYLTMFAANVQTLVLSLK